MLWPNIVACFLVINVDLQPPPTYAKTLTMDVDVDADDDAYTPPTNDGPNDGPNDDNDIASGSTSAFRVR